MMKYNIGEKKLLSIQIDKQEEKEIIKNRKIFFVMLV